VETVLSPINKLWKSPGMPSYSPSTFARSPVRLLGGSPGSSLHREPPPIGAVPSLEREPHAKLAGSLRAIHTRHGRKVTITDVGLRTTATIDGVIVAVKQVIELYAH